MSKYTECSAILSSCRQYRYELWRKWGDKPYCAFIGLNPSTADENIDDPTIRRCVGFAKAWGYGGLCMVNLFAFRATKPEVMMAAADPIGPENNQHLQSLAERCDIFVAAWGKDGSFLNRDREVKLMLPPRIYFLKKNKDDSPAHPLYLKSDLKPELLLNR